MIYRLYLEISKEINAWESLYRAAKLLNSTEMIVYGEYWKLIQIYAF